MNGNGNEILDILPPLSRPIMQDSFCLLRFNLQMKTIIFIIAILSIMGTGIAAPSAKLTTGTAVIKDGILTITHNSYKLSFIKKSSWTIQQMYFGGKLLLSPTGAFGTVANLKVTGWHGTGHGNETVENAHLQVDDTTYELNDGINVQGSKFVLYKESVIGPYRQFDTITFDGTRIVEDFHYEIISDDSNVNFIYAFMHCFTNKTDQWMAQLKDGSIDDGKFLDDNSFTLQKEIRWAAVYDSSETMGMVYVYPEVYKGKAPFNNSFWNRPRDNKLYLRPELPKGIGQKFHFNVTLQAFNATPKDWRNDAKRLIANIENTPSS